MRRVCRASAVARSDLDEACESPSDDEIRLCRTASLTIIELVLTFIETKLFTRLVQNYFTDDEYAELQNSIVVNPGAGDLVRGSGGVRKVR